MTEFDLKMSQGKLSLKQELRVMITGETDTEKNQEADVKAIANRSTFVVAAKDHSYEDIKRSLEIIIQDLDHAIEMEKKGGETEKKNGKK